jgi:hypothetical protein
MTTLCNEICNSEGLHGRDYAYEFVKYISFVTVKKKVKLSLYQAMEAHRVVRR